MSSQPIARPPAERTLLVAITILCIAAVIQIFAAVIALVPRIDYDKLGRALDSHKAATLEPQAAPAAEEQIVKTQQINSLLGEAKDFEDKHNLHGALEAYTEAERLDPGKPDILYAIAKTQFLLGSRDDSAATLKKLLALPAASDPANAQYVSMAKSALAQLNGQAAAAPDAAQQSSEAAATPADSSKESAAMRDDVGIPIGSVMGIVSAELLNGEPGHKNLRISLKASSSQKIDPMKVHATVDFYEQDDQGEIQRNSSPSPSEWLSNPIDWADSNPEIFQVKYRLPLEDRGDLPPLQYYGYVVAIYYDGELQDQRADPPPLLEKNAPPLHKDPPAE